MRRLTAMLLALLLLVQVGGAWALDGDPAREVFDILWSEDETQVQGLYERLDETAQQQITPQVMLALKGQLTAAYGELVSVDVSTVAASGDYEVYTLPVQLQNQGLMMQLVMQGGTIFGLGFVPLVESATPAPQTLAEGIVEMEVTVGEGTAYPLPGTLTLPQAGEKLPLVVLVHGSGPNDRNETVGATQLFYDLAQALAQQGIATLRYDKRTYVFGPSMTAEEISSITAEEETIQDAILAGRLAQTLDRIDPEQVYVLGHSLGGILGPRISKESEGVFAGLILAAGTPKTLLDIAFAQNQAMVNQLEGEAKTQNQLILDGMIAQAEAVLAMSADEAKKATLFNQNAYYFWEMAQYSGVEILKELALPTLILQGSEDFQVTPANGLEAWQAELGEPAYVTYKLYEGLNHVFMAYTGDPAHQYTVQEYNTPASLAPQVAADIAQWVLTQ